MRTGTPPYPGGLRDQPAKLVLQVMVIDEERRKMEEKKMNRLYAALGLK